MEMLVLCGRIGSHANLCCTVRMEGSTGTEVKRALTSKDVITSRGSSLLLWISWTKCCASLRWWGDWPTRTTITTPPTTGTSPLWSLTFREQVKGSKRFVNQKAYKYISKVLTPSDITSHTQG